GAPGRRSSGGAAGRTASREDALEQFDVLAEVPRAEEVIAHRDLRRLAESLRVVWVGEQRGDARPERLEIFGVDEVAGAAVLDLVLDAADARGDDRPSLPHRL